MIESNFGSIDQAVGLGQTIDDMGRQVTTFQGHDVDTPRASGRAFNEHERRHVVQHSAQTGDERKAADRGVVMNTDTAGERCVVVNVDMTTQQRTVGHDDMITKSTIMRDMTASHQEVVIAEGGDAIFFFRAAINRYPFANGVTIAVIHRPSIPIITLALLYFLLTIQTKKCPSGQAEVDITKNRLKSQAMTRRFPVRF